MGWSADRAAVLTTSLAAREVNAEIGVGFWTYADAERFAQHEQKRTGQHHVVHADATPFGTHELWFVRPTRVERRAAQCPTS